MEQQQDAVHRPLPPVGSVWERRDQVSGAVTRAELVSLVGEVLVDSLLEQIRLVDQAIAKCQETGPSAHSAAPPGTDPAQERVRLIRYFHTEWQRLSTILSRVTDALTYPPK